jgi:hypothetical protein
MVVTALPSPAIKMLSRAGDDVAEVTWLRHDVHVESCWRQSYRVMLATTQLGRLGRGTMYMRSYASNNATKSCWRPC